MREEKKPVLHIYSIIVYLGLALVFLAGCSQPGQPATGTPVPPKVRTVAEIAMLDLNPERQKILEQGARAEGEVMFYTTSTGMEPLAKAFMQKYPFIKAEVFHTNIPTLIERTRAEAAAGKVNGDVLSGGFSSFMPLADLLTSFKSPGANFSIHPKGAINTVTLIVFAYNTGRVSPAEVPQKLDDLLSPRWKGKLGFHGPPNTWVGLWTGMMIETWGEEGAISFLKKLSEQNLFLYQSGGVGMQALVTGEIHLGTQSISSVTAAMKSKSPVAWVALEPTRAIVTLASIFEKSPHPYSAMLFVDFLLSPEGQKVVREESDYLSMRDLEQGEAWGVKLPKTVKLESPADSDNIKKWNALFTEFAARKK